MASGYSWISERMSARLSLGSSRADLRSNVSLLGRDLRQVPDEQNQAPGSLGSVPFAESWHAAQTNSILNCVVELAIALVLRPGRTQVGRFRIEALAEKRLAPSVRVSCPPLLCRAGTTYLDLEFCSMIIESLRLKNSPGRRRTSVQSSESRTTISRAAYPSFRPPPART
jgi:hypothetical protein